MTPGIGESLVVSLVAAIAAYWRRFLSLSAAVAAAMLGGIVLHSGGCALASATACLFLITALLSERQARVTSDESSVAKERRNLGQIIANGILLAVLAVLYRVTDGHSALIAAYLGCAGAVAGDTWATSATQFTHSSPRLLTSGKRVPPGTPGAVTGIGIALTAMAGIIASLSYLSVVMLRPGTTISVPIGLTLSIAAIIGALAGSLFDSYLGAACQASYTDADGQLTDRPVADDGSSNRYVRGWRWLSNDLVNFSNSVAGALSAILVWAAACWLNAI